MLHQQSGTPRPQTGCYLPQDTLFVHRFPHSRIPITWTLTQTQVPTRTLPAPFFSGRCSLVLPVSPRCATTGYSPRSLILILLSLPIHPHSFQRQYSSIFFPFVSSCFPSFLFLSFSFRILVLSLPVRLLPPPRLLSFSGNCGSRVRWLNL